MLIDETRADAPDGRARVGVPPAEERLHLAVQAAALGIYDWNLLTKEIVWSPRTREIFALASDEQPSVKLFYNRIHPQDHDAVARAFATCTEPAGDGTYRVEFRIVRPDGTERQIDALGHAHFDATQAGRVATRIVGVLMDVTDQRRLLASLSRAEARFRSLVGAVPSLLFEADDRGHVTWASESWRRYTGLDDDGTLGAGWQETLHPGDRDGALDHWRASVEHDTALELRTRLRRHDGAWRWHLVHVCSARVDDGPRVWVGAATDIHEQVDAEERLRVQAERLERADRRKDEFLAMLAHELRNPLASLVNAFRLLRRDVADDPRALANMEMGERQVMQLTRLVEDLLEVSRITQGKILLRQEPMLAGEAVYHAVATVRPQIDARGQLIAIRTPETPGRILADPARIAQVLENLLHNASKYTPDGGRIAVDVSESDDRVTIRVADDGIGISPELLPRVFDLFMQADAGLDRSNGGLGIGLALVRLIVGLHGGTARADSEGPGRGSVFTVELPAHRQADTRANGVPAPAADAPSRPIAIPRAARSLRVLVVDDHRDTADSLGLLLQLEGHDVVVAYDGRQAIAEALRQPPDVAFLDLGLPTIDGFAIAAALREATATRGTVLVAMTGYGQPEDRQQTRAAGFSHHLVKPVSPERVSELLRGLTPRA